MLANIFFEFVGSEFLACHFGLRLRAPVAAPSTVYHPQRNGKWIILDRARDDVLTDVAELTRSWSSRAKRGYFLPYGQNGDYII